MIERFDVLVVGAGPAGLAAAQAAAARGARVGLLDAQAHAGGQVWRRDIQHTVPRLAQRHLAAVSKILNIEWMAQTRVVMAENGRLLAEGHDRAHWFEYGSLVLATGARELLLPFPGWTLPGVTGVGGLQALAKQGWPLAGQRVVVAGSGPLLLAAAATAHRNGARVLGIHEQAGPAAMRCFALGLWRWPGKLAQAAVLRAHLRGIPYHWGSVVCEADGTDRVEEIEWEGPSGRGRMACDVLAVGYGLVPDVELARMLGCRLATQGAHAYVLVDAEQRTSIADVYAAGEACGIGGRDTALVEGTIAGLAAMGATSGLARMERRSRHARAFAAALYKGFRLDPRVRALARPDTLVCRCEDVPLGALDDHRDARGAKLATRCGMGACQGRICGAALAEMGRFAPGRQRPPLFPVRLATLSNYEPATTSPKVPA